MGIVHDKPTGARRGLVVQNTVIEPGWPGVLLDAISGGGAEPGFGRGNRRRLGLA
jgi:deoxycytidine triphosphate deaminase